MGGYSGVGLKRIRDTNRQTAPGTVPLDTPYKPEGSRGASHDTRVSVNLPEMLNTRRGSKLEGKHAMRQQYGGVYAAIASASSVTLKRWTCTRRCVGSRGTQDERDDRQRT